MGQCLQNKPIVCWVFRNELELKFLCSSKVNEYQEHLHFIKEISLAMPAVERLKTGKNNGQNSCT